MRIRISTTSHVRIRIKYCKSRALHLNVHNEIKGSYDKIIITIVPSYTRKNITRLLPLELFLLLRTCNNTDCNKLGIFSSIASYYGDNYNLGPEEKQRIESFFCCCEKVTESYISVL